MRPILAAEACDCAVPMPSSSGLQTPVMIAGTMAVLVVVPLVLQWLRRRRVGSDEERTLVDEMPER